jgi:(2S)-methylsuccinyl-CoA dehydrogenase|tara:strand:- start:508 stop:2193 length:1686 start_codon:yes stop_codon:yes gene_type:complete
MNNITNTTSNINKEQILSLCHQSLEAVQKHLSILTSVATSIAAPGGPIEPKRLVEHQYALHGYAWMATYITALREFYNWAERLNNKGLLDDLEILILQCGFGSYLKQLRYGIAMSQDEFARPFDLGIVDATELSTPEIDELIFRGDTINVRQNIAKILSERIGTRSFGNLSLDDTHTIIRDQFSRFSDERVAPEAQAWHIADELIPMEIIMEMSDLGVFGLTLPEENGGLGLDKTAMCIVTEELSRGYIGVGSLSTRSEIAAELIRFNGTNEQKERYLAPIASGSILPTAVFTEPNHGSDLAHIRTRAKYVKNIYKITGNKIWITHGARSDLMTLLARTNTENNGYGGLSMFLAEKPRGTDEVPFPAKGMSGSEIRVLGYRGMKEYEIAFDSYEINENSLLGGEEGNGFKQLMSSFETARIQTAARAIGVAQNALELSLNYANVRSQFNSSIIDFARVGGKIGWMAVETMIARQLTYFSARQRDNNQRCDIEAGMAKLLAARVAWSNADNGVQIHGGNGYAEEFVMSRVLCDARILNVFEGAAEIQAGIIARGLLSRPNRP